MKYKVKTEEAWIPGWEGQYSVTTSGEAYSYKYGEKRRLKSSLSSNGYTRVNLSQGGKVKVQYIHRLVAMAHLKSWDASKQINHIDGNKVNNTVLNLEVVTPAENIAHGFFTGIYKQQGTLHPWAKLTEEGVRSIRKLNETGKFTHIQLAAIHGTSGANVGDIVRRKSWRHLI